SAMPAWLPARHRQRQNGKETVCDPCGEYKQPSMPITIFLAADRWPRFSINSVVMITRRLGALPGCPRKKGEVPAYGTPGTIGPIIRYESALWGKKCTSSSTIAKTGHTRFSR